jgi:hypothetical protein
MKEHEEKATKKTAPFTKKQDPFQPKGPRDGYDNTGTQGYDSLADDGYTGAVKSKKKINLTDEDKALDSGI